MLMPNLKIYSPKSFSKCFLLNDLSTLHPTANFMTTDLVKTLLLQAIKQDLDCSKVFFIAFSPHEFSLQGKSRLWQHQTCTVSLLQLNVTVFHCVII